MRALPILILLQACASSPILGPSGEIAHEFHPALFEDRSSFRSIEIVESLSAAVRVKGWSVDSLILFDGRGVPVPGVGDLRLQSLILTEITREGVEVRGERAIGLVRIWHWCGNDPVKRHVARVDLGDLLGYHADKIEKDRVTIPKGFTSGLGWDVDDYHSFRDWQKSRTTASPPFHVRYILRKDLDTLIVFYDGRFQFAESADGSKVRVDGGVLPDSLLAHLRETVVPHCPITILTDEGADLILGVLRSVLRLDR